MADVEVLELGRTPTGDVELDRVLGQGVVPGAVVLLGGEPGIGKSTLMLQSVLHMATHSQRILYVAGEESPEQVRMRAERLGTVSPSLFVFAETDAQAVLRELEANKPDAVIIDSIQTMFLPEVDSAPGSVAQIRETAAAFTRFAKQHHVPVFFIGHITKTSYRFSTYPRLRRLNQLSNGFNRSTLIFFLSPLEKLPEYTGRRTL